MPPPRGSQSQNPWFRAPDTRSKGPNFRVCDISSMHLTVSASEACEGYQVAGTMRFIMLHELLPASPCVKAATTHKENDQKDY